MSAPRGLECNRLLLYLYIYIIWFIINPIQATAASFTTKTCHPLEPSSTDSPGTAPSTPTRMPAQQRHTSLAPPTQRCERAAPHSADYVRQKTRQQNVLRADGQHDEQQRLEAHNVAFRADGECAAAGVTRSTRSAGEQAIAPDKPVRVGAQATVCDAVDFRVQAQYAVQHLLLLNSRLHVQLQLVNHSLKVPECGKGLVRKRSQLTRTGETVRVRYWDRAILARSRRSDAVITDWFFFPSSLPS